MLSATVLLFWFISTWEENLKDQIGPQKHAPYLNISEAIFGIQQSVSWNQNERGLIYSNQTESFLKLQLKMQPRILRIQNNNGRGK